MMITIPKGFILRDMGGRPVFELLNDVRSGDLIRASNLKSLNGDLVVVHGETTEVQRWALKHASEQYVAAKKLEASGQ